MITFVTYITYVNSDDRIDAKIGGIQIDKKIFTNVTMLYATNTYTFVNKYYIPQ